HLKINEIKYVNAGTTDYKQTVNWTGKNLAPKDKEAWAKGLFTKRKTYNYFPCREHAFSLGFLVLWCQILANPVYCLLAIGCPRIGIFYLINLQENIMEKYDIEALWLATIVRFSTMIPSLVIALATTHGRAYKWVMGWDFNTFCWVFAGICAGLGQYLGTTLTKKTIATFVSSFTPISMILVIGLSAMIVHDRIKKPSIGGVIMIVIRLCIFHWREYRSTSKEGAQAEKERLRWRLNLRRRFELWRRLELMRRDLMHVQKDEHSV
ncbi:hypothetical protein DVH24_009629, partial [Malus domestica]